MVLSSTWRLSVANRTPRDADRFQIIWVGFVRPFCFLRTFVSPVELTRVEGVASTFLMVVPLRDFVCDWLLKNPGVRCVLVSPERSIRDGAPQQLWSLFRAIRLPHFFLHQVGEVFPDAVVAGSLPL